ncbi:hypothetical protein D3C72_1482110 [compost metagenome]
MAAAPRQRQPPQCTAGTHQQHEQQRLEDADAAWYALPLSRQQAAQQKRAVDGHGLAGSDERRDPRVAEDGAVQPQFGKNRKGKGRGQCIREPLHALRPVGRLQPQREGKPHGDEAQTDVHGHHHEALGCA